MNMIKVNMNEMKVFEGEGTIDELLKEVDIVIAGVCGFVAKKTGKDRTEILDDICSSRKRLWEEQKGADNVS